MDFKIQNEGWEKIKEESEPLYKSIESEIQYRLQSHGGKYNLSISFLNAGFNNNIASY